VGGSGDGEILAVAAENDWRLRRSRRSAESTTRCATTGGRAGAARRASGRSCTTSPAKTAADGQTQASDLPLAHGSRPGRLNLTGVCVDGDAVVDAVVDDHEGIGTSAERAVLVAVRRGLIRRTASVVAGPLAVVRHQREIHRLGVDEFQALERVIGADPE